MICLLRSHSIPSIQYYTIYHIIPLRTHTWRPILQTTSRLLSIVRCEGMCHCILSSVSQIPRTTIPYHTIPYHTIPYHSVPYHPYRFIWAKHGTRGRKRNRPKQRIEICGNYTAHFSLTCAFLLTRRILVFLSLLCLCRPGLFFHAVWKQVERKRTESQKKKHQNKNKLQNNLNENDLIGVQIHIQAQIQIQIQIFNTVKC